MFCKDMTTAKLQQLNEDPNEDIFQHLVAPQEIFHVCRSSSHLLPAFRADARPQAAPGGNISLV